MIVAGAANDHELLIAQGLLSTETWITIKSDRQHTINGKLQSVSLP
jgi:hypothetical protein